jgi:carbon storage regulator
MGGDVLILRRRAGETILVGSEVEIEVLEVSRSRVKLGVRAPSHIPVIRKETLAIAGENQMASDLVASCGHEGIGELLQRLKQPALLQSVPVRSATGNGMTEDGSTKPASRRYETPERYSGYRRKRENPHPA